MFKVSKETYDKCSDALNRSETYGRYTRLSEDQVNCDHTHTFVAPELSQVERVKIAGFPSAGKHIEPGQTVDFLCIKNGAPGNVAVQVFPPSSGNSAESSAGRRTHADVVELSADSYAVHVPVLETGTYRVHIRFNDVELPRSPLTFRSGPRDEYS